MQLPWMTWIFTGIPFALSVLSPFLLAEWLIKKYESQEKQQKDV
jgi:hypothetical protein